MKNDLLLDVKGLKTYFPIKRGVFRRTVGWIRAVDGVSFAIRTGETLGLVGESGCGKSTILRSIVRAVEPADGQVLFHGDGRQVDVTEIESDSLRTTRQQIRVIFQDPQSSLNPRFKVRDIIAEPLKAYGLARSREEVNAVVTTIMANVGLDRIYLNRYPFAMSGGQMQRVGIGRALATNPRLILADEPTSALDVSVQAQILNLIVELQTKMHLSVLFVTHDLSVVRYVSDRIAIMYLGRIVEIGPTDDLFGRPLHPYTEALFSAIPEPNPHVKSHSTTVKGDIPDAAHRPSGCSFHPRCPRAEGVCSREDPALASSRRPGHDVACHFPLGP